MIKGLSICLALWSPWFSHPVQQQQGKPPEWAPALTIQERGVLDLMVRLTPSKGPLLIIRRHWYWIEAKAMLMTILDPGGFALVEHQIEIVEAENWLKSQGWLFAEFKFRDFHVYKKPMPGGLFLVKRGA